MRARGESIRPQRRSLIDWARQNGREVPFTHVEQFARVASGAEHSVYYDPERRVAVKATHLNRFGHSTIAEGVPATPLEYLDRLALQNLLFGDDIRIEGVASDDEQIEIITTQPWIVVHPENPTAPQREIDEYFAALGFAKIELTPGVPMFFQREAGIIVADAHDQNILRHESGHLVPIDLVIGKPGPELLRRIEAALGLP